MKSKAIKKEEAAERQGAYDALTPLEKWSRLQERPGRSDRESARLWALIKAAR